jgi:DNA-binding CsgD family transcriptional regulator
LNGFARLCGVGYAEAAETLHQALSSMSTGAASTDELRDWCMFGTIIANEVLDERTYANWVQHAEDALRKSGALLALQVVLVSVAENNLRIGKFAAAEANYEEVVEITAAVGGPVELYQPLNAPLLAWRGDDAGTRAAAKLCIDLGDAVGVAQAVLVGYYAISVLEIAAGRYEEALLAAEYATNVQALGWIPQMLPIVIEAAARSQKIEVARRALDELEQRARAAGTTWAFGLLERSRALLSNNAEADSHFQRSITHFSESPMVVQLAWTHLVYGEWLRRQERRPEATEHLRIAYESFDSMGASGFAERARLELLATGDRVRRRTTEVQHELTAQELHIARLASGGATNPEIGAEMFLSSNTVDYHLKKVFRKLGVTSRRQLRTALPG